MLDRQRRTGKSRGTDLEHPDQGRRRRRKDAPGAGWRRDSPQRDLSAVGTRMGMGRQRSQSGKGWVISMFSSQPMSYSIPFFPLSPYPWGGECAAWAAGQWPESAHNICTEYSLLLWATSQKNKVIRGQKGKMFKFRSNSEAEAQNLLIL